MRAAVRQEELDLGVKKVLHLDPERLGVGFAPSKEPGRPGDLDEPLAGGPQLVGDGHRHVHDRYLLPDPRVVVVLPDPQNEVMRAWLEPVVQTTR